MKRPCQVHSKCTSVWPAYKGYCLFVSVIEQRACRMTFIIYQQDSDRGAPEIRIDSSIAILSDNSQVALIGKKVKSVY